MPSVLFVARILAPLSISCASLYYFLHYLSWKSKDLHLLLSKGFSFLGFISFEHPTRGIYVTRTLELMSSTESSNHGKQFS